MRASILTVDDDPIVRHDLRLILECDLGNVAGIVYKPFDERLLVGALRDALEQEPLSERDDNHLRILIESMVVDVRLVRTAS